MNFQLDGRRALVPFAAVGSGLLWVWPVVYYPWEFAGGGRVSDAEPGAAPDRRGVSDGVRKWEEAEPDVVPPLVLSGRYWT